MKTVIRQILIHFPRETKRLSPSEIFAIELLPYPVIVVRHPEKPGHFVRYANFPVEFLDEEMLVEPAPEGAVKLS